MKNIIILSIALVALLFTMSSCEPKAPETEPVAKVTVSGIVEAELNIATIGLETVPSGTKLIFRIDSKDLVQSPSTTYQYQILQYETTVGADGKYSIELPAVKFKAAAVTIIPVEFEAEQRQADNSTIKRKIYTGIPTGLTVQEGERYFLNLAYAAS